MNKVLNKYPHSVDIEIFRESILYSATETGFTASLIEKDYFCSLILDYLFGGQTELVFKGGTCLSKVYFDFYRISEDLDFIIPIASKTTKSKRRSKITPVKPVIEELARIIPGINILSALTGHNQSKQYIGYLQYHSAVLDAVENIKIEIGLREPLLQPFDKKPVSTIATNPFSDLTLFPEFSVQVMNIEEALSEKIRAALTRREPAIRDFYDIHLAIALKRIDLFDQDFLKMVMYKISIPGNAPIDVSSERKDQLNLQLNTQLRPVLRKKDFVNFNLDQTFLVMKEIAAQIA